MSTETSKFGFKFFIRPLIVGLMALALFSGSFELARYLTTTMRAVAGLPGIHLVEQRPQTAGTAEASTQPTAEPVVPAVALPPAWDGASRVTILLLGVDTEVVIRDGKVSPDRAGPARSDTMILLTIDPQSKTAGMLSIPRDLWTNIPRYGYAKINTAYSTGEANKLPGGGPELAMKTVEDFLGITVNYYAQIDFNTLVQFIDFLDGIRINVPKDLKLTTVIGADKPLYLKKGERVTLNGQEVLAYVRYRYSGGGDFDRSQRQQLIMLAIRDKLVEPYWQTRILGNAMEIYNIFSGGIRTNMTFDEIMAMGLMVKDIQVENIKQGSITPPKMVTYATAPDGTDILKPITAQIRKLRDEIFSTGNTVGPMASTMYDQATLLAQENASVAVYNGSNVSGLAGTTEQYLKSQGVNVTMSGNGDLVNATTIILYNAKPYTYKYLIETMKIQSLYIKYEHDPSKGVDIAVIVGNDWTVPQ